MEPIISNTTRATMQSQIQHTYLHSIRGGIGFIQRLQQYLDNRELSKILQKVMVRSIEAESQIEEAKLQSQINSQQKRAEIIHTDVETQRHAWVAKRVQTTIDEAMRYLEERLHEASIYYDEQMVKIHEIKSEDHRKRKLQRLNEYFDDCERETKMVIINMKKRIWHEVRYETESLIPKGNGRTATMTKEPPRYPDWEA